MATVTYSLPQPALAMTAAPGDDPIPFSDTDFRALIHAVFPDQGVVSGPGHMTVMQRQAGANMSIDIGSGSAVVQTDGGKYFAWIYSRINVPITGINTNPAALRTHKVYLAIYDKAIIGDLSAAAIVITEDTGSGAPVPPGDPQGYIQLGQFTISPSQTSITTAHITDTRPLVGTTAGRMTHTGRLVVDFDDGVGTFLHGAGFKPTFALFNCILGVNAVVLEVTQLDSWTQWSAVARAWIQSGGEFVPYDGSLEILYLVAA